MPRSPEKHYCASILPLEPPMMEAEPPSKTILLTVEGFSSFGEDILEDILTRLPAPALASAACVSRSWSLACNRILTRGPKLLSALSINPHFGEAVNEVLDKVLAAPIRPHFAIASIGKNFSLPNTYNLIRSKLGSRIPIIVSEVRGIIGNDAITNEHREWIDDDDDIEDYNLVENRHRGIVLTIGFLPGLKVCLIPLMHKNEGIDKFITDIKDYAVSVSGSMVPVGIIMFADPSADLRTVLEKMDYGMSRDTIIIGNASGRFVCNNGVKAVINALVFATDRGKTQGTGEIYFGLALSTGISPIGPIYKGASVRVAIDEESENSTWLTARREGSRATLDGESILQEIENVIENDAFDDDLYIGVTKRRKCSIGSEKGKMVSSMSFHEVLRGDEDYLYVKGDGIKTGDTFQFFRPDPQIALVSRNNVFENLRAMRQSNGDKNIVCGGLIFNCYGRGETFLGRPNVDSSAFLENFPRVPLSGVFCSGEIGRSSDINCFLHVYSTFYLLIIHSLRS